MADSSSFLKIGNIFDVRKNVAGFVAEWNI